MWVCSKYFFHVWCEFYIISHVAIDELWSTGSYMGIICNVNLMKPWLFMGMIQTKLGVVSWANPFRDHLRGFRYGVYIYTYHLRGYKYIPFGVILKLLKRSTIWEDLPKLLCWKTGAARWWDFDWFLGAFSSIPAITTFVNWISSDSHHLCE